MPTNSQSDFKQLKEQRRSNESSISSIQAYSPEKKDELSLNNKQQSSPDSIQNTLKSSNLRKNKFSENIVSKTQSKPIQLLPCQEVTIKMDQLLV